MFVYILLRAAKRFSSPRALRWRWKNMPTNKVYIFLLQSYLQQQGVLHTHKKPQQKYENDDDFITETEHELKRSIISQFTHQKALY